MLVETLLRLFAITTFTAAAAKVRRSSAAPTFWITASAVAFFEPLPFLMRFAQAPHATTALVVAAQLYFFNLVAAYLYRRGGVLAAVSFRFTDYVVWHVIAQSIVGVR